MFKCIVIDNEQYAIDGIVEKIGAIPELVLIGCYSDAQKALDEILTVEVIDILFSDIEMPKVNGLDLAEQVRGKVKKVIFTTGHSKYAYEAFEAEADAFLLKPYSLVKFISVVRRVINTLSYAKHDYSKNDFFFVKCKGNRAAMTQVKYRDIVAVEGKENYVVIHMDGGSVTAYMTLKEMLCELYRLDSFIQMHRSFIISKNHVKKFDSNQIEMSSGITINIGESYRQNFREFVTRHSITSERGKVAKLD